MNYAQPLNHTRNSTTVIPLHNAGGIGKTTLMIAAIEACFHHGVKPAISTGDANHNELSRLYKATSFDVRIDGTAFINALSAPEKINFIDTPAAFVDIFNDIFGNIDTVLTACEIANTMPAFLIPVATLDKCIKTINRVGSLFNEVTGDYRIIYALNEGLMTDKNTLIADFQANDEVQREIASGRATVIRNTTKFTPPFSQTVKTQKLRPITTGNGNLMEKVLALDFLNKTDEQFAKVLGLPPVPVPIPVKK